MQALAIKDVDGNAVNDGGLAIDLSAMRRVVVNHDAMTATVQGGARLGDVDRATQRFGLAEDENMAEDSFAGNLERLRHIKARYDPQNLFRGHLDVRPAASVTVAEPRQ